MQLLDCSAPEQPRVLPQLRVHTRTAAPLQVRQDCKRLLLTSIIPEPVAVARVEFAPAGYDLPLLA